jgi:multicomponent Na+:H+ antiporter subunit G
MLIIVFFLATAPVAAHMIGRAAYEVGVELWKGTVIDEWKSRRRKASEDKAGPAA